MIPPSAILVAQAVQKQVSLDNMRQQAAAANARGQEVRPFPVSSPAYARRFEPGVSASKCLRRALSLAFLHICSLTSAGARKLGCSKRGM